MFLATFSVITRKTNIFSFTDCSTEQLDQSVACFCQLSISGITQAIWSLLSFCRIAAVEGCTCASSCRIHLLQQSKVTIENESLRSQSQQWTLNKRIVCYNSNDARAQGTNCFLTLSHTSSL